MVVAKGARQKAFVRGCHGEEGRDAFDRARKLLNPKLRVAESIEFKSATTPDGEPARPTAAPQS